MSRIERGEDADLQITVWEGEDLPLTLVYKANSSPEDISGYTVSANLKFWRDDNTVIETFDTSIADAPNGVVNFKLTKAQIDNLVLSHDYAFDVFANDGTYNHHWLSGTLEKREAA